ncbi:YbfB/YjiJ family MFS transporter [Polaromonas sp.]|uniref:YbfB/YjiJ family MFS transporter n=1 Tax=Polaromonas sp. TaxID=1869339 RepID=UPI00286CF1E5|nr:YbfB/YjiJ family MFS transporter [Polaromonas sp.]
MPAPQALATNVAAAPLSAGRACLAGFVALVIAMGIGRFAFTPLLPLMQAAGQLDLTAAAWLASANYLGYFAGASTVSRLGLNPQTLIRASVPLIALLTAAMSWTDQMAGWFALRFGAGVLSAWVLVGTSAWCLAELARSGRPALAGLLYAGVGTGISLAGLYCLLGAGLQLPATTLWWQLGALAALLAAAVLVLVPAADGPERSAAPVAAAAASADASPPAQRRLVIAYGCFGFGYILPATFLPAMARAVLDDPAFFGWAWPVFGLAAAASTWLASRYFSSASRIQLWVASQLLMAAGTALPAFWPSAATVLLSATLVGGSFMVITMAGLQEARARAGAQATRLLGQMTAAFAVGQIAGPIASALLGLGFAGAMDGIRVALVIATLVLVASALWLLRRWPLTIIQPKDLPHEP